MDKESRHNLLSLATSWLVNVGPPPRRQGFRAAPWGKNTGFDCQRHLAYHPALEISQTPQRSNNNYGPTPLSSFYVNDLQTTDTLSIAIIKAALL